MPPFVGVAKARFLPALIGGRGTARGEWRLKSWHTHLWRRHCNLGKLLYLRGKRPGRSTTAKGTSAVPNRQLPCGKKPWAGSSSYQIHSGQAWLKTFWSLIQGRHGDCNMCEGWRYDFGQSVLTSLCDWWSYTCYCVCTGQRNEEKQLGFVLRPCWMNIAIKWAKRELVIIGIEATLSSSIHWRSWLRYMTKQQLVVNGKVLL